MLVIVTRPTDCIVFSCLLCYAHFGVGSWQLISILGFSFCISDLIDRMESCFKMESLLLFLGYLTLPPLSCPSHLFLPTNWHQPCPLLPDSQMGPALPTSSQTCPCCYQSFCSLFFPSAAQNLVQEHQHHLTPFCSGWRSTFLRWDLQRTWPSEVDSYPQFFSAESSLWPQPFPAPQLRQPLSLRLLVPGLCFRTSYPPEPQMSHAIFIRNKITKYSHLKICTKFLIKDTPTTYHASNCTLLTHVFLKANT